MGEGLGAASFGSSSIGGYVQQGRREGERIRKELRREKKRRGRPEGRGIVIAAPDRKGKGRNKERGREMERAWTYRDLAARVGSYGVDLEKGSPRGWALGCRRVKGAELELEERLSGR